MTMDPTAEDVTDAQLAVLRELWDRGPSTIRQLAEALYHPVNEASYATVQKLLERLESRRHVTRDRAGHAHVFTATTPLEAIVGLRMRAIAEKLTGGQMAPLLTHLVKAEALSDEERTELRQLIDEMDAKKPKPRKRRQ